MYDGVGNVVMQVGHVHECACGGVQVAYRSTQAGKQHGAMWRVSACVCMYSGSG